MYKRILVPIDGSTASQRGFGEALALAKRLDASMVLFHVVEYYPVMMEMATASTWDLVTTEMRQHGQRVLEHAMRRRRRPAWPRRHGWKTPPRRGCAT